MVKWFQGIYRTRKSRKDEKGMNLKNEHEIMKKSKKLSKKSRNFNNLLVF